MKKEMIVALMVCVASQNLIAKRISNTTASGASTSDFAANVSNRPQMGNQATATKMIAAVKKAAGKTGKLDQAKLAKIVAEADRIAAEVGTPAAQKMAKAVSSVEDIAKANNYDRQQTIAALTQKIQNKVSSR